VFLPLPFENFFPGKKSDDTHEQITNSLSVYQWKNEMLQLLSNVINMISEIERKIKSYVYTMY